MEEAVEGREVRLENLVEGVLGLLEALFEELVDLVLLVGGREVGHAYGTSEVAQATDDPRRPPDGVLARAGLPHLDQVLLDSNQLRVEQRSIGVLVLGLMLR